jgi:hypothetical protein
MIIPHVLVQCTGFCEKEKKFWMRTDEFILQFDLTIAGKLYSTKKVLFAIVVFLQRILAILVYVQ